LPSSPVLLRLDLTPYDLSCTKKRPGARPGEHPPFGLKRPPPSRLRSPTARRRRRPPVPARSVTSPSLEQDDVADLHFIWCVLARQKVVEIEECWDDKKIFLALAQRLGLHDAFPWKDVRDYCDFVLTENLCGTRTPGAVRGFIISTPAVRIRASASWFLHFDRARIQSRGAMPRRGLRRRTDGRKHRVGNLRDPP
jgi:hypothetical protein